MLTPQEKETMDKLVKPIFQAMTYNMPEKMIRKVFFDAQNPLFLDYLPETIKEDPSFMKEALEKNMIAIDQLPENLRNSSFISKSAYISLIENSPKSIGLNIYPQDNDIVYAALANSQENILKLIDLPFKKDEQLMAKVVLKNINVLYEVDSTMKQKLKCNFEVMSQLISNDPQMYHELKTKQKSESEYLKLMLKDIPRYNEVKEYLAENKDPEIALLALKITKNAKAYIHPKYQEVLKGCESNKDTYTYLKIFVMNEKMRTTNPTSKNTLTMS